MPDSTDPISHRVTYSYSYDYSRYDLIGGSAARNSWPGRRAILEYDHERFVIRGTDCLGRTITWAFDRAPRPNRIVDPETGTVSEQPGTDTLSLDNRALRIVALVLEPGGTFFYRYDESAARIRVIEPNGLETVFPDQPGLRLFPVVEPGTGAVRHIYQVHRKRLVDDHVGDDSTDDNLDSTMSSIDVPASRVTTFVYDAHGTPIPGA